MSDPLVLALALGVAFLAGSIPFGLLVARAHGIDLRTVGSGNIGATNVGRALGRPWAVGVFFLDMAKGLLPTWGLPLLAELPGAEGPWLQVGCGLAAILGHCFPPWLAFRGGKGVATTVGVLLALDPLAFLAAGGVWIVALLLLRMVSVASLCLGVAFPLFVVLRHGAAVGDERLPLLLVALAVAALIAVRHRSNLARVLAGTEPKVFIKRAAPRGEG